MKYAWINSLVLVFGAMASVGCTPETSSVYYDDRNSPTFNGPAEQTYCSNVRDYSSSSPVSIDGFAKYRPRLVSGSGLGAEVAEVNALPIRYAEVRVVNSAGVEIQCDETDGSGEFDFQVPASTGTFTVQVYARGINSFVQASVLNKPEFNALYSITTTFTAESSKTLPTFYARATGENLAAAFNIFDKIVLSNDYLRTAVSGFSVAPKVSAYWANGFNPNSYFGSSSGLSFYLPGYRRLFILGGINDNVDTADTDHFDNSIIVHEYGHFIEDVYTNGDSPGGSHNGNKQIDPRLAWSEAWGNFFQAAVNNDPYYIDTIGNSDGSTRFAFRINLESLESRSDYSDGTPNSSSCPHNSVFPGCDIPYYPEEGQFREFAITRFLWDLIDTNADENNNRTSTVTGTDILGASITITPGSAENFTGGFSEIWSVMIGNSLFKNSAQAFRDVGLLHQYQQTLSSPTDWSTLRTAQRQPASRRQYAQYVEPDMSCSGNNFSMGSDSIPFDTSAGNTYSGALLHNHDFFFFKHNGGPITLTLVYDTPSGVHADLDMYLYNESARLGNSADIKGTSNAEYGGGAGQESGQEVIDLDNLPAGNYLINIMAWLGASRPGETNFSLTLSGVLYTGGQLCPKTL